MCKEEMVQEMNIVNYTQLESYNEYGVVIFDEVEALIHKEDSEHPLKDIWAFLLVKKGNLKLSINERNVEITQNDLLFYSHNHFINRVEPSEDFRGTVMVINARLASELIHSNVDMMKNLFYIGENPILHLSNDVMSQCQRYFELIRFKWNTGKTNSLYNRDIIHSIARAALYEWASIVSNNIPEDNETRALRQGERLFKNFIYELTNDQVKSRSVTDYANRLCVTPKYLSAVCKQVTGKTASTFINFYMVKDIKQLLKYSDKSIKEIAQTLGFPNLSFFGKYVKAHLGVSPTAYRKQRD